LAEEKLGGNQQKLLIIESLMEILNFRVVCYYLTNLQSCDQKYNLNVINIYEEKYHQFLDMIYYKI